MGSAIGKKRQDGLTRVLPSAELKRRCESNPRYSLRAFSRMLGISHSVLSTVLSGKRPLSRKTAEQIAERLAWSPWVRAEIAKSRTMDILPDHIIQNGFCPLTPEEWEPISEWYYSAVLCLLKISGSKFEPKWISERIGISEEEAKAAIERLKTMGLVERLNNEWRPSGLPLSGTGTHTTTAIKTFHRQYLSKAVTSLENDPFPIRRFISIIIAMDPAVVPYAVQRIEVFKRELCAELESMATPSEVYKLMIQLFPVTKPSSLESREKMKKK
jgi:DNA-binding Lrp family transcriptional regulator